MITIFIPVYYEEKILKENILFLYSFLEKNLKKSQKYQFVILDSNSLDNTPKIAEKLQQKYKNIMYLNNPKRGKGIAIKEASLGIKSDYYSFIDIDIPIKLEEYLYIIKQVIDNKTDICIGSKYVKGSSYNRPFIRIIGSKIFNLMAKIFLNLPVKDIYMGAKVWNQKVNKCVWDLVEDERWFFDIEFLYYANRKGFKIKEMPVTYKETRMDSKLNFFKVGMLFLKKLTKLIFKHMTSK
tara:strand:- start:3377 stop:4093 length:717 start_codon:yes stop_codon:yes gene_type:complete